MNLNKPDYAGKSASELIEIFEAQIAAKKRTTVRVKTSDLSGAALNWAVAQAQGEGGIWFFAPHWEPSTDWAQAGPIVEREGIALSATPYDGWRAYLADEIYFLHGPATYKWKHRQTGPTPLIAAMRCYVARKLGDEVDVPVELIEETA